MTTPQSIEHLDFDIDEDEADRCDGSKEVLEDGTIAHDQSNCPYQARYEAFRRCCGHVERLCKDCYNFNCLKPIGRNITCKFCGSDRPYPPYDPVFPL